MRLTLALLVVFLTAGCKPESSGDQLSVRIVRDTYGVAHVYADDIYGLYFGYGYAVAQDRLFQMEMTRRSTQGTVAAVLGDKYLEFDKTTRRLFDPGSIRRQLEALSDNDRDIFAGYAAGMNAWLTEVRAAPNALMPRQFAENSFQPEDWVAYDVAMIFVGTMVNRFGDFNTELDNLKIFRSLVA
jgi:penicillin amidase